MIVSILIIIFPPLVKNVFTASKEVASLFLAIFSIGVAIGSVAINRLLQGKVSAKYSSASVIAMAGFILHLYFVARSWIGAPDGQFYDIPAFVAHDGSWQVLIALLGISVSGGRSEEHTSELQSLMRISYAVFCLKKKKTTP